MVKIYTTPTCPKCKILKKKMDDKNIKYEECQDVEQMNAMGFTEVPQIVVYGNIMGFAEANNWINDYKG